jgi:hypothetical protein
MAAILLSYPNSCQAASHQISPFPAQFCELKRRPTAFRHGHDAPARLNILVWWEGEGQVSEMVCRKAAIGTVSKPSGLSQDRIPQV